MPSYVWVCLCVDYVLVCAHVHVSMCVRAHTHVCIRVRVPTDTRSLDRSPLWAGQVPPVSAPSAQHRPGLQSGTEWRRGGRPGPPCPPPDAPPAESSLSLSSTWVSMSPSRSPPEVLSVSAWAGPLLPPSGPSARRLVAPPAARLPHSARLKVSRCVFGLKDDVFTERLHWQLQMTFQESNYSVSVFAEFGER